MNITEGIVVVAAVNASSISRVPYAIIWSMSVAVQERLNAYSHNAKLLYRIYRKASPA